ncbi:hypothetical protein NMG60_11022324 [Bertholletia excelsa]
MATASHKTTMFLNMALILSPLIIISIYEGRSILDGEYIKSVPSYFTVNRMKRETHALILLRHSIIQLNFFNSINPNLNCDSLFEGQWLCVDGATN